MTKIRGSLHSRTITVIKLLSACFFIIVLIINNNNRAMNTANPIMIAIVIVALSKDSEIII